MDKNILNKKIITLLFISVIIAFIIFFIVNKEDILATLRVILTFDIIIITEHLQSSGFVVLVVSAVLVLLQALGVSFPSLIMTIVNSLILGWFYGTIFTMIVSSIGATLAFFIARKLGRNFITKFIKDETLAKIDKYFDEYGSSTIIICRLLPFVPYALVSYSAGLSTISYKNFIVSTIVGRVFVIALISYMGESIVTYPNYTLKIIMISIIIVLITLIIKKFFVRKNV